MLHHDLDMAPSICKLDCIRVQVQKHLLESFLVRLDEEARAFLAIEAYSTWESLIPRTDLQFFEGGLVFLNINDLCHRFLDVEHLQLFLEPLAVVVQDGEVKDVVGEVINEFNGLLDLADALLERRVNTLDAWQDLANVENLRWALL